MGRKTRYGYASRFHPTRGLLFDAMLKHDGENDHVEVLDMGESQFNQEIVFAPRINSQSEDDGYVVGFVQDESEDRSECWIIDAQKFTEGPIARVHIPKRVPYGFHSHWVGA